MTPILTSCAKGTAAMMAPAWRETRPAGPQRRRGRANGTARVPRAALGNVIGGIRAAAALGMLLWLCMDCPATPAAGCSPHSPLLPPKNNF